MVNEEARKERHAKLKQENIQLQNPSAGKFGGIFGSLKARVQQICKDHNNNPLVGKLMKKIVGFTVVFLLISPFVATYQLTQGAYDQAPEDSVDLSQYTNQNTDKTIADVMTEDGFLLKPAINSAVADRSGFSEIFVYTVEPGDTLSSIAQSFNIKKETIMSENGLSDANRLKVGSQIRILPVDGISYVVKKGDTVDKLAKKYKIEKGLILSQNQLDNETLVADTTLIIPGAKRDEPVYIAKNSSTAPAVVANYSGPKSVGRLIWPTIGILTQPYHTGHLALDIANRNHAPIFAAAAGKVIRAETSGWNGGYGNVIIIDNGHGMQTLYGHNEKVYVKVGQYVEQGQTIAWMGHTGNVRGPTGIHCHFEVRINGVKYNPMNFF
jgi:murein DD-endopeptidase MepM/ murein hydrolase activator NlpD